MQDKEGVFIVIEGTDGSGKGTQFKLLIERLELAGYEVATFDFPRYDEPSSYFVKEYLNGKYGTADEVGPYTASLFYALDRYEAGPQIRQALREGKVVLANRFTGSNMAHQGTKFRHADERRGYFIWLDNLEFEMLHIPRPNLNLVLRVPADIAQSLVDKKEERSYTDKKRDIHEADLSHLERAVTVYDDLCQLFPKDFMRIDCVRNEQLMPIETISNLIWEKVFPYLPKPSRPRKTAKAEITASETLAVENPYVEKGDRGLTITDMGKDYLKEVVTDPEGPVYAFTDTLNPTTIAAAMARLSRRNNDMRTIILDEFAHALGKDKTLLQSAIAEYGDESVQQLASVDMVVEGASNLLAKKLEWGRLGSYLEQSTQYAYFDQKDKDGKYKYFIPEQLDEQTKLQYCQLMDKIFDTYSIMVRQLVHYVRENSKTPKSEQDSAWKAATRTEACDALRATLPVAAKSTVGIHISIQSLNDLVARLQSDELGEARTVGRQLLEQARKVAPTFLERVDIPKVTYRAATSQKVKQLATEYLPDTHVEPKNPVDLVDVWPRNELQLVADMLYEHTNLSLRELRTVTESWPYDKKVTTLATYFGERTTKHDRPGRALEKVHYSWDLLCDYSAFRELQRHRMVDDLEWQHLTPRFGFDMPELVEEAGLGDLFEVCFDASLKLYSILQQGGYTLEAQYATLLGHKLRWKVTYNAREAFHIHELHLNPENKSACREIVQQMHEKVAEVHPMIADAMKFISSK